MYKPFYSQFLKFTSGQLHLTAHSHHFWPDVTQLAQASYWIDSARLVDQKWDYFFSEVIPETQELIANFIGITNSQQISFAPNTHEFVNRLYSCLPPKAKVLSSDAEFYSFVRQTERLQEANLIEWTKVSTQNFSTFTDRWLEQIKQDTFDFIFISRVFFNSGQVFTQLAQMLESIEKYQSPDCLVVVDDYHGFMAIPINFKPFEHRFFYLAGSYKYAQAGEGCCFLISPVNSKLRPLNTGWFASFNSLSNFIPGQTLYASDGYRFSGATLDFSGLYRLRAVLQLLSNEHISVLDIHNHVTSLQHEFLNYIGTGHLKSLSCQQLLGDLKQTHGHFLTFELPNESDCQDLYQQLKSHSIFTDFRKNRLRFGFGMYHEKMDFLALRPHSIKS